MFQALKMQSNKKIRHLDIYNILITDTNNFLNNKIHLKNIVEKM